MTTTADNEGTRSFATILHQIGDGQLHSDLSEAVRAACMDLSTLAENLRRDQKGTITLKVTIVASTNGMVVVGGDVDSKLPKEPRAPTTFWLTKAGNLTVENPRQQKLPLRDVTRPAATIDIPADDRSARSV